MNSDYYEELKCIYLYEYILTIFKYLKCIYHLLYKNILETTKDIFYITLI